MIPNIPERREDNAEPADLVIRLRIKFSTEFIKSLFISLVSTTAVGFNLFLGGSMATGTL